MSVACDDGNFSSPKSSQEGVAFPFGRRTRFPSAARRKILGAPRGFLSHTKYTKFTESRIVNSRGHPEGSKSVATCNLCKFVPIRG